MREPLVAALLVASCASPARTVIHLAPGAELVCAARAPGAPAAAPDAAVVAAAPDAAFQLDDAAVTPRVEPAPAVRDVDPARLALLPAAERSWSLARVVRCEGARAVIVRRDARVTTRPIATLRAPRLAAGVEVMALWEGGPTAYHAVVLDTRGDAVRVRYDDGTEETLDALRLDAVIAPGEPAPARVCPLAAGAAPAVLLPGEAWQRAVTVVECGGAAALVEAVSGREEVPAASLTRAVIAPGDRVRVRWRDGNDWPARVDRAEGRTLAVTYDDGSEETIALGQVVAWSAPAEQARPAARYVCPR